MILLVPMWSKQIMWSIRKSNALKLPRAMTGDGYWFWDILGMVYSLSGSPHIHWFGDSLLVLLMKSCCSRLSWRLNLSGNWGGSLYFFAIGNAVIKYPQHAEMLRTFRLLRRKPDQLWELLPSDHLFRYQLSLWFPTLRWSRSVSPAGRKLFLQCSKECFWIRRRWGTQS